MVGKLSEQAFQQVFFHIFLINVKIVMNFGRLKIETAYTHVF